MFFQVDGKRVQFTMSARRWALAALLLMVQCAWAGSVPERIRSLAGEYAQTSRAAALPYDERAWLERFYSSRGYAPAWTGAAATQALDLLSKADEHGLAAQDYDPRALASRMRAHNTVAADDAADQDAALTLTLLRYLADLHAGRIRSDFAAARAVDPVPLLQQGLADSNLAAAVGAAEPRLAIYHRLKATLAEYRKLAMQPATPLPAVSSPRAIGAGAAYAGARELGARLALLGDLADGAGTQTATYSAELAQAVKRFQDRHGLEADGKLGRQTLAALNVPLAVRVRQIELSMERLRWLPDLSAGPFIAVNLPSFRLWAFEAAGALPVLATRVIVGKAVSTHQTPLFIGTLRYIEFNPYWNVPPSILRDEIVPALLRDANYLVKNDMEVVGPGSQTVDAATLAALRAGSLRVRQRPGPRNALGAIKFALPNAMNIYLHSTPARALFARSRRDFSHGCIRVEDTVALANFVLGDQAGWTSEAVAAAMAPGPNRTVQLKAPMPVVIFYTTAIIDLDGRPLFPHDVYRLDGALERSLAARAGRQAR